MALHTRDHLASIIIPCLNRLRFTLTNDAKVTDSWLDLLIALAEMKTELTTLRNYCHLTLRNLAEPATERGDWQEHHLAPGYLGVTHGGIFSGGMSGLGWIGHVLGRERRSPAIQGRKRPWLPNRLVRCG